MLDTLASGYDISTSRPLAVGVYPPANESRKGVTATDGTMCKLADVTRCFVEVPEKLLRFYSTECIFREIDGNGAHICCFLNEKTSEKTLCWSHGPTFYMLILQQCECEINLSVYSCPYKSKENMQRQRCVTLSSGVSTVLLRGLLSPFLWWYVD